MNQAPSMLKPALISGVAFGVAGAIPVINWINCACCALIVGCGFCAAFLYSKECRTAGFAFRPGNGATVGLVSGLIYGQSLWRKAGCNSISVTGSSGSILTRAAAISSNSSRE